MSLTQVAIREGLSANASSTASLRVIEPNDLPDYLATRNVNLDDRQIRLLAAHLSRYIRATQ